MLYYLGMLKQLLFNGVNAITLVSTQGKCTSRKLTTWESWKKHQKKLYFHLEGFKAVQIARIARAKKNKRKHKRQEPVQQIVIA